MKRRVLSFALVNIAIRLKFEGNIVGLASVVAGGVAPIPWHLNLVEEALTGNELSDRIIEKAAASSGEGAIPLSHNGYKVPFLKGMISEASMSLKSAGE
jgi:xanthine dehydrogenase YagS FAD-binding subunit